MYTTTITKSGQITLTKSAREYLGVKPGDRVYVDFDSKKLVVERRLSEPEFLEKLDAMKSDKTKKLIKKYAGMSVSELKSLPGSIESYKRKCLDV